jgi:DegV family protein with EDD domain
MGRVRVVTDTTHYLPAEAVKAAGIELVSLYVNWNGGTDRESEMGDFGAFYRHLGETKDLPTTSQPSVGDFLAVFQPIVDAGDDVVSIHLSGAISGTVGAAHQARQALVEQGVDGARIGVHDSETACGGMGVVALAAAARAEAGGSVEEVLEAARGMRADLKIWFAVDTLEFLRRGGRIGAAQAYLGSALRIKPILTLGKEIEPVERVRTAGRAVARMKEYLDQRHAEGADRFAVQHIRDPERAAELVEHGRSVFGSEPLFVSEVGPVIGTHVGPGLLGVTGVRADLLGG